MLKTPLVTDRRVINMTFSGFDCQDSKKVDGSGKKPDAESDEIKRIFQNRNKAEKVAMKLNRCSCITSTRINGE